MWSVAPLNHLMKSPCQAFGAVLLHFRCICCAAQHVRANLIPQAGVQLPESQRTNVSTLRSVSKAIASKNAILLGKRIGLRIYFLVLSRVLISSSACLDGFLCMRLSIYCVALFGLASFIQMNTFQVAECLCSHPANRI